MNRVGLTHELAELQIQRVLERGKWRLLCDGPFQALFAGWGMSAEQLIPVDEVETVEPLSKSGGPVIVCTEKPEGPYQQQLQKRGVTSLGLYSQVIPRLAAGLSPRFSPRGGETAKIEYAIVCSGRCGSTLLARELAAAGAGNPIEHLRQPIRSLLRHRSASRFDFTRWWDMVRIGHNAGSVFGTKIIYGFWEFAEEFLTSDERAQFLEFLCATTIVRVRRRDRLAQAVSDFIAGQTGVWHLWRGVEQARYAEAVQRLEGDLDELVSIYDRYTRHELKIDTLIKECRSKTIDINYESFISTPKRTVIEIVEGLGLGVISDYEEKPLELESTTTHSHFIWRERLAGALDRRGPVGAP